MSKRSSLDEMKKGGNLTTRINILRTIKINFICNDGGESLWIVQVKNELLSCM
jgi:hypothetical protein